MRSSTRALVLAALALPLAAALHAQQQAAAPANAEGKRVYERWCSQCHGDNGQGDGPGAIHLLPRPRDFTRGLYQIRSTATGAIPTDDDIRRVVDEGMPGTSMPAWKATLSSSERAAVVQYVKNFSNAFRSPAEPLAYGSDPGGGQAAIDSGRALFRRIECFKCHGDQGRGDGRSAPTLKDDWGYPIRAADLGQNWRFNGGGKVEDIYHRLRSGLDGTPMPAFGDLVDAHVITDGDLWRIAHFVRSLSPEQEPRVRDVVSAPRIAGNLPTGPDDSAWAKVDSYYFPLVGQVIIRPRWFAPTVNGVWVQAVHNGQSLAIRVRWDDPSQSPDSGAWRVWRGRMARTVARDDSGSVDTTTSAGDRIVVEFPTRLSAGMERPYFMLGSTEQPVYLWRWESEPGAATEALASGADHVEPMPPFPDSVAATATYDHGQWRVQFVRTLTTADSTNRLQFVSGRPIPMAIFAWDGSNSESGTRMSIGSWVNIHLGEPARAGTVVWPLLAMLGTGGLGLLVVGRAQKAAGTSNQPSGND